MADTTPAPEQATAQTEASQTPAAEAPKPDAAPAAAASEPPKADAAQSTAAAGAGDAKKEELPGKGAAAADAAKNAAKAGLQAFQKIGSGAAQKSLGLIKSIVTLPLQIFKGDLNTKLLTLAFLASAGLVVLAASQLYKRVMPTKPPASKTAAGSAMNKLFEQEKEFAIATANLVFLDRFSSSLSAKTGRIQVYEFELFIENDSPETSAIVKAHIEEVREFVANAMQGQSYEELLSVEGKEKLKKHLTEALNRGLKRWTKTGSVKRLYFTRFVMG